MNKQIQEPVVTLESDGSKRINHPAFGIISAARVSGGHSALFDSDFTHQHYMTLTIKTASVRRDLSNNWNFGGEELIEIAMSESQWATFVSSLNVGSGTPCTLRHVCGEYRPQLPNPDAPSKQFKEELCKSMSAMQDELKSLAASLKSEGAIGKKRANELSENLSRLAERFSSNVTFVANQFDEHVERTIENAKIEVNAYANNLVTKTGIDALRNVPPGIAYQDQPLIQNS